MGDMVKSAGSLVGIGNNDGYTYTPEHANDLQYALNQRAQTSNLAGVTGLLSQYGTGKMSLQDAMTKAGDIAMTDAQKDQFNQLLATDPTSGSMFATDQVRNSPILGQLFGQGGLMNRLDSEEQNLAKQGFKLTEGDHEAYGQAAGNIARLFGQQEQGMAQSLADRGLAQGGSGAALAGFAGLQGNKNEQLAQSQMQIANQRMQNTTQRLQQSRELLGNLGTVGANAIQQQYGRQLSGAQAKDSLMGNTSQLNNQLNAERNQAGAINAESRNANKGQNLMDAFGGGLMSSAYSFGATPGKSNDQAISSAGSMASGSGGSGGGGGMGMMALMSDERSKQAVAPADSEIEELLSTAGAHSYEYKDTKHGVGRFVSPMAQELEKTAIGKSMIVNTPEGKMVDYARGFGALLAAQVYLYKQLEALKGSK